MRYFLIDFKHILTIASLSDPYLWSPRMANIHLYLLIFINCYSIDTINTWIQSSIYFDTWGHHITSSILRFQLKSSLAKILLYLEFEDFVSASLFHDFFSLDVKLSGILMHLHYSFKSCCAFYAHFCDIIQYF